MTRGRPPKKAVKDAVVLARRRGSIVELPDTCGLPFDFMIFSLTSFVFVKVRRMRARMQGPRDVAIKYGPEIRELRILPQGGAAMTELWILSSHTVWQYFRILPGSIVEIREDGAEITETGTSDQDSPSAMRHSDDVPAPSDFTLPDVHQEKHEKNASDLSVLRE